MSTPVTSPDTLDLDLDLALASVALHVARAMWDHCPSAANIRRLQEAQADVDALLDRRLGTAG